MSETIDYIINTGLSTNNRVSSLVNSQVPFFVRNDHRQFITFLEKYYEFLESNLISDPVFGSISQNTSDVINKIKNVQNFQNIDVTEDRFAQILYSEFLKFIPTNILADKTILIKHIKDFYRAKGTEKSVRFLLNIMFGDVPKDFYYPKKDILKVSDGKWYIQKSIRVVNVSTSNTFTRTVPIPGSGTINPSGDPNIGGGTGFATYNGIIPSNQHQSLPSTADLINYIQTSQTFTGATIKGRQSNAIATVERSDYVQDYGTFYTELFISNIEGQFQSGEEIYGDFYDSTGPHNITGTIFGNSLDSIKITNPGLKYSVGDPVIIESDSGTGAYAIISRVSGGDITSIGNVYGGAGFLQDDDIIGFGDGTDFEGIVTSVLSDGAVHPAFYDIVGTTIDLEQNTVIGNTVYSNLVFSVSDPANNWIANSMSYWTYGPTGPVLSTAVLNPGRNYSFPPLLNVLANTSIISQGILGRMEIAYGGSGYQVGDIIEFINYPGNYGTGAMGIVSETSTIGPITDTITKIDFIQKPGHQIGGRGYSQSQLPIANVRSSTGTGAIITVTSILGDGEYLVAANSDIGAIREIEITSRGSGYLTPPTINLSQSGDGTATAEAFVLQGIYSYPGYFLNDDGQVSSYNFLEDRDFYQYFSYVIRSSIPLEHYRKAVLNLTHPIGTKLFGEYVNIDEVDYYISDSEVNEQLNSTEISKSYTKTGNSITIDYEAHNLVVGDVIGLEFTSGQITQVKIIDGGSRYTEGSFESTSNSGSGLQGTYTVNQYGSINSITVTDYGSGYNDSSDVTILPTTAYSTSNLAMTSFVQATENFTIDPSWKVNTSIIATSARDGSRFFTNITDNPSYFSYGDRIKFSNNTKEYVVNSVSDKVVSVSQQIPYLKNNTISKLYNIAVFSNVVTMNVVDSETFTQQLPPQSSNVYFTVGDTLRLYTPNGNFDVVVLDYNSEYSYTARSNLLANVTSTTTTSNLAIRTSVYITNVSNLTVTTGPGNVVNVITLSDIAKNSNINFTIGDRIVVNEEESYITFMQPISKTVKVLPGFSGNLDSELLSIFQSYTKTMYEPFVSSNLIIRTEQPGKIVTKANLYYANISNLVLRTGSGDGNVANLYSVQSSNLIIKTGLGTTTNVANLYYPPNISNLGLFFSPIDSTLKTVYLLSNTNTSNLLIKTGSGVSTNSANLYYPPVTSNLTLFTSTDPGSTGTANLYVATPNTTNLVLKAGPGVSTNVANLYYYPNTSNLTLFTSTDPGATGTANLYSGPNTSNLILKTASGSATNIANLFYPPNISNLTIFTTTAGGTTLVANLYSSLNTTNLFFRTGSGTSTNVANLYYPPNVSNLTIITNPGTTVNIANLYYNNTSNLVVNTGPTSANIINLSQWAQNCNIFIGNGTFIKVGSNVCNVVNTWLYLGSPVQWYGTNANLVFVTPALPGGLVRQTLQIFQPAWVQNSNVAIANATLLSVDGIYCNVTNTGALTQNTIFLSPNIGGNTVSNTLRIYRPAWVTNGNLTISNVSYLNANSNTVQVVNTWSSGATIGPNNIIYVSPALPGNSEGLIQVYPFAWAQNSNVAIANGTFVSIGGQAIGSEANITLTIPTSSQITISTAIPTTANANIKIYQPAWVLNGNIIISNSTYLNVTSYFSQVTNTWSSATVYYPNNAIYVSPALPAAIESTLQIYSFAWAQNSNTTIANGMLLQTSSGAQLNATSIVPTSSLITFSPTITGNTLNANIKIYVPAWRLNSNVRLSNSTYLVVGANTLQITNSWSSATILFPNNTLYVSPALRGNSEANLQVYSLAWAQNSNVAIANGTLLSAGGQEANITSVVQGASLITFSPTIRGNTLNANVKLYQPAWVQNSNVKISNASFITTDANTFGVVNNWSSATVLFPNNKLHITPALIGNTEAVVKVYQPAWAQNSNIAISNGSLLSVYGLESNIVNSQPTNSILYLSQAISTNVINNTIKIYQPAWVQNSNIAITNGLYILTSQYSNINVTNTWSSATRYFPNNSIYVSPALPASLEDVIQVDEPAWAANSNVYINLGTELYIDGLDNKIVNYIPDGTNQIYLSSNITGNFFANYIKAYEAAWPFWSNTLIETGDTLSVNGYSTSILFADPFDNRLIISGLPGGLEANTFSVAHPTNIANSNTSIEINDFITINSFDEFKSPITRSNLRIRTDAGSNVTTGNLYFSTMSNLIIQTPSADSTYIGNLFSSITSSVLTVSTPIIANSSYSPTATLSDIAANSDIPLANGTIISVNGRIVTLTSVDPNSTNISFVPFLDGGLSGAPLNVYAPAWAQNSNVSITTGTYIRFMSLSNTLILNVTSSSSTSNTITFSPNVPGNVLDSVRVYATSAAKNASILVANGTYINVNGKLSCITSAYDDVSQIQFYPPLDSNVRLAWLFAYANVNNTVQITYVNPNDDTFTTQPQLPANLSNVPFSVTKNYSNINLVGEQITIAPTNLLVNTSSGNGISQIRFLTTDGIVYNPAFPDIDSIVPFGTGDKIRIIDNGLNTTYNVFITNYDSTSGLVTITPSLPGGLNLNTVSVYTYSYVDQPVNTSNAYIDLNYGILIDSSLSIISDLDPNISTINVTPKLSMDYILASVDVVKYANLINIAATTNTKTNLPSYNLNNADISTVTNFSTLSTQQASFETLFLKDSDLKIVKDGLYKVTDDTNPDVIGVTLNVAVDSIIITNSGAGYQGPNTLVFTGGGGQNLAAEYAINDYGNITSIIINDLGSGYTYAPTANANGSNTRIATFNVVVKYVQDAVGNVIVSKKTT